MIASYYDSMIALLPVAIVASLLVKFTGKARGKAKKQAYWQAYYWQGEKEHYNNNLRSLVNKTIRQQDNKTIILPEQ